jgi:hypothetical protein
MASLRQLTVANDTVISELEMEEYLEQNSLRNEEELER